MSLSIMTTLVLAQFAVPNTHSLTPPAASVSSNIFDIREFGATADMDVVNTNSIQNAIDACTDAGGGVVLVSGGNFITGTIYLKDNVTLHIAEGARLSGSTNADDYATDTHKNIYLNEPHMDRCLIFARNARHIAIEGKGTIDGQGHPDNFPNTNGTHRPMLLRFYKCSHLRMRDVHLVNPASWTSAWLYCEDIVVHGVRIESRVNWNGDGMDFDGCRNVRVSGCFFDTSDDSICLQASRADYPCKDIAISDCVFVSKWAGMRIGLSSLGDFENIVVTNCVFRDISDSGLKIQMCEGGVMKNMIFSNLVMRNVPRPVFMTFNRFRMGVDTPPETPPINAMGHMQFNNIIVDNTDLIGVPCGFVLSGIPGHYIEDLVFHNISIRLPGGGVADEAAIRELPSFVDQRPEFYVLGERLPFAAFYARHVRWLKISDIRIETARAEARPAVFCCDVDGLIIRHIDLHGPFTGPERIRLAGVDNADVPDI